MHVRRAVEGASLILFLINSKTLPSYEKGSIKTRWITFAFKNVHYNQLKIRLMYSQLISSLFSLLSADWTNRLLHSPTQPNFVILLGGGCYWIKLSSQGLKMQLHSVSTTQYDNEVTMHLRLYDVISCYVISAEIISIRKS